MSEGAWILMATSAAGVFGIIITAIIKRPSQGNTENHAEAVCPAHSGIKSDYRALHESQVRLENGQEKIWDAVDEIRKDVKEIARYKSNGGSG